MICSFCDTKMDMTEREGIRISLCPQCGGIWLQRGALEGILARSSRDASDDRSSADNQRSEDDDDDGLPMQGGGRGRSGNREGTSGGIRDFLGNLFDFG